MRLRRFLPLLCIPLVIAACVASMDRPIPPSPVPQPSVTPPKPPAIPARPSPAAPRPTADRLAQPAQKAGISNSIDDLDMGSLEAAIERSLRYYEKLRDPSIRCGNRDIPVPELKESLAAFREIIRSSAPPDIKLNKIRDSFDFISSSGQNGNGAVLFTGYYVPVLEGSPVRTNRFQYPVYRKPDDLVALNSGKFNGNGRGEQQIGRMERGELIPYYSRDEIDRKGVLEGRRLELFWVDDLIALYSLHVQGSGKIRMPDGRLIVVSYAQSNGRPFRSISKALIEKGKMTDQEVSYPNVQNYLKEHPEELRDLFSYNERYIFFRRSDGGPMGSLQFPVTSGRTIATDPDFFPKGALALIETRKPLFDADGRIRQWIPLSRFVLNQDTGAAIKGPARVDIFCGDGPDAEKMAGSFRERGELYLLLRKK